MRALGAADRPAPGWAGSSEPKPRSLRLGWLSRKRLGGAPAASTLAWRRWSTAKTRLAKAWKSSCSVCGRYLHVSASVSSVDVSRVSIESLEATVAASLLWGVSVGGAHARGELKDCLAAPSPEGSARFPSSCSTGISRAVSRMGRSSARTSQCSKHLRARSCCGLGAIGPASSASTRSTNSCTSAAKPTRRRPLACGPAQMQSRE
mmetsp:Transcript_26345/g.79954  ORF Transcript_26345/g.79954 Transcript_26345/m.79954 type:complete len:206 (+) Transcript_26345:5357-5974(+)